MTTTRRLQLKVSAKPGSGSKGYEKVGMVTIGSRCVLDGAVNQFFPVDTAGRIELLKVCRQMEQERSYKSTEYRYRNLIIKVEAI